MFFLAESPWTTSPTENAPPQQGAELTCYRRNLFQITGSVTLPRALRYIITDTGDRIPIVAHELTVILMPITPLFQSHGSVFNSVSRLPTMGEERSFNSTLWFGSGSLQHCPRV
uniref:Acid phosphatase type 5 n=1 Tax=Emericella nidulans TaxID=162425 RepID=Q00745_EMEND|nr:acid phosphatase type 5 [Aspergillus nidulans]